MKKKALKLQVIQEMEQDPPMIIELNSLIIAISTHINKSQNDA